MSDTQKLAFGIDPRRPEKYSLRQSRYYVIAKQLSALAGRAKAEGRRIKLLDVGVASGICRRYINNQPNSEAIDHYGADLEIRKDIYEHNSYKALYETDLMQGMPAVPSGFFDIVVCEQVLEHLTELEKAFESLERVLKPGGILIVGVPIFPHGLHLIRKYIVPLTDKIFGVTKIRGHVQAFSLITFKELLRRHTKLEVLESRGFRIISGGILRPLENYKFWLDFNLKLGKILPALCIEVQVVARKRI